MSIRHKILLPVLCAISLAASATGELPEGATVIVEPLTQALWNQGRHYNRMAPVGAATSPDGRMYAGCVATGTGIVMAYYKWPLEGQGTTYYTQMEKNWTDDLETIALRARFDVPYDWDSMLDVYGNIVSAKSSMAVATLMSDIGATEGMQYGDSGSSTLNESVSDVLVNNFGFSLEGLWQTSYPYDDDELAAITKQLRDGHPIICSGLAGASGKGHTYVCDGYAERADGTYVFHFNFGWGGTNNGWYPLDSVFTQATASDTPKNYPVNKMLINVLPQKAPQISSHPDVSGPNVALEWRMPGCWEDDLTGFTLERQTPQVCDVSEDLTSDWNVRSSGWGWETVDGKPVATSGLHGDSYWATGITPNTVRPIVVSADATVTITYRARKFPNGVTLSLIRSDKDGFDGYKSNSLWVYYPVLATLPGGSSNTQLEEKTVTISGDVLSDAFGYEQAYFGLKFEDPNFDTTHRYETVTLFELVSFTVSGKGETWTTQDSVYINKASRSYVYYNAPTGDTRFRLSANYESASYASAADYVIAAAEPVLPTASVVSTNETEIVFEVSGTSDFSYEFVAQSNALHGKATHSGNRITYTLDNLTLSTAGTHWLTLYVTDNQTKRRGKCVFISDLPTDHPLCPYTEPTFESAAARAKREGKLILLISTGDPDSTKFSAMAGILSSNVVVEVIKDKFIVVEAIASTPDGYALANKYWREQPQVGYGSDMTTFTPTTIAYAIVIDPYATENPYPSASNIPSYYMNSASRWNYFNSQYDFGNIRYAYAIPGATTELVRFLSQKYTFPDPVDEPDNPDDPVVPSVVNIYWKSGTEWKTNGNNLVSFTNSLGQAVSYTGTEVINIVGARNLQMWIYAEFKNAVFVIDNSTVEIENSGPNQGGTGLTFDGCTVTLKNNSTLYYCKRYKNGCTIKDTVIYVEDGSTIARHPNYSAAVLQTEGVVTYIAPELELDDSVPQPVASVPSDEGTAMKMALKGLTRGLWYGFEVTEDLLEDFSVDAGSFTNAAATTLEVKSSPRTSSRGFFRLKSLPTQP